MTRLFIVIAVVAGSQIGSLGHASAKVTVAVTHSNGTQRAYRNVVVRVRGSAMSLTSSDVKGTLTIGKAACTQVGHLQRCIIHDATLHQVGEELDVRVRSGTAWLDLSAQPHGVRFSLQTEAGTTVSANGTIDRFEK